jgi:lycopene cyclase domain-containing protein
MPAGSQLVIHLAYLAAILGSAAGVIVLNLRLRLRVLGRRLAWAISLTLPVLLAFDAVGASRGWFHSDPGLSLAILPFGISLEEPFLLAFLVLLSVVLWRGATRLTGEG